MKIVHEAGSPLSDPMPSEPSRAGAGAAAVPSITGDWSVLAYVVEKSRGRNEEQVAGHGTAEIEQAVVVAGRAADEHVVQHLFDRIRGERA